MRVFDKQYVTFPVLLKQLHSEFLTGANRVEVGSWQSKSGTPMDVTYEIPMVTLSTAIPPTREAAWELFKPNLPWAEMHFEERVSAIPYNPPPSDEFWPYTKDGHVEWKTNGQFSHTYPERFWPKWANNNAGNSGIRFNYGDLWDVVELLKKQPHTRQAYLPVWFPEDTGVVHGERVPCTLGYHFVVRDGNLSIVYYLRSCDFRRHFRDDIYLTARLAQWVAEQLDDVKATELIAHISSLHIFEGDRPLMEYEKSQW